MARALIKRVGQQSDNNGHKRTGPPCAFNQIGGCARGCVINPEHKYWIVFWGKKQLLLSCSGTNLLKCCSDGDGPLWRNEMKIVLPDGSMVGTVLDAFPMSNCGEVVEKSLDGKLFLSSTYSGRKGNAGAVHLVQAPADGETTGQSDRSLNGRGRCFEIDGNAPEEEASDGVAAGSVSSPVAP